MIANNVPIFASSSTKKSTLRFSIPVTNKYCSSVDIENGKYYVCRLCGNVQFRENKNRLFTNGQWIEHENSKAYKKLVEGEEEFDRIEAKKNAGNGELTKMEGTLLAQKTKNQMTVLSFFTKIRKMQHPLLLPSLVHLHPQLIHFLLL